jgi:CubicO group peptidase (beta-lactamase class C family)
LRIIRFRSPHSARSLRFRNRHCRPIARAGLGRASSLLASGGWHHGKGSADFARGSRQTANLCPVRGIEADDFDSPGHHMLRRSQRLRHLVIAAASLIAQCAVSGLVYADIVPEGLPERDAAAMTRMTERISEVARSARLVTVGAALIRDGRLVWTGYFGEETPGIAAGPDTRFNVASVTKLVATQTVLRLVADGQLSLDQPMAPYWVDPDIANDPRHRQLTARMALTHTSGFPNWRFFLPGGKLRFLHDPGSRYGYSGEGIEYVARYAESKLGIPFPDLVLAQVFDPLDIDDARLRIDRKAPAHVARPVDEEGKFHGHFCRPGGWCRAHGSYSAADDLVISVPDFARFLVALMDHRGYGDALALDRDRVQAFRGQDSIVRCVPSNPVPCPKHQGYGLGVEVVDYGDSRVIGHGGSDWSEMSLAYAYLPSRDGVILFVNAPNRFALEAMPRLIEALDPASPYLTKYREWASPAQPPQGEKVK